jgi:hypothetical protein
MRVARERRPEYLDVIVRCLDLAESSRSAPGGGFSGKNAGINLQSLAKWGVPEKLPDEMQRKTRRTVYYRVADEAGVRRALRELDRL